MLFSSVWSDQLVSVHALVVIQFSRARDHAGYVIMQGVRAYGVWTELCPLMVRAWLF